MKDIYKFISFLYSKIGWRIWVWLTFIILAALLDGLSVGFFIPILEAGDENNFVTREVKRFFDFLGISYSIITSVLFMAGVYSLRTVFLILQEIYSGRMVANLLATIKKMLLMEYSLLIICILFQKKLVILIMLSLLNITALPFLLEHV